MSVRNRSRSPIHAESLLCREAALLLRAGEASPDGEDLALPIAQLLTVVSAELDGENGSISEALRCAVVQLAAHLVRRSSIAVPSEASNGNEAVRRQSMGCPRSSPTILRRAVPYTESMRLGRMG